MIGVAGARTAPECQYPFTVYQYRFTVCQYSFTVCQYSFTVCQYSFTVCHYSFTEHQYQSRSASTTASTPMHQKANWWPQSIQSTKKRARLNNRLHAS